MTSKKVVLVTGASRGIGAAIAEKFAQSGWDLTISGRREDTLEQKAHELRAVGAHVKVAPADMSDADAVQTLIQAHLDEYATLNALVLNAGMGQKGRMEAFPVRRLDRLYEVNVRSPFLLMQGLLPALRAGAAEQGSSNVIAISSISGVYPEPELAAYGATKAALIKLCEVFNLEESSGGVSATALAPGYVDTDLTEWTKEAIPGREMITTDDIAWMAYTITKMSRYAVVPTVTLTRPGTNLHRA
ncbi:SDR family NAD(P)-dependent oxidoreductase [Nocardia grenadensis]|uniref:SDR family NAD(P)-dependent oxidoreductase n=1 Tax=Nocardia grenadensis TaxID=931537 RepID=UPI003D75627D